MTFFIIYLALFVHGMSRSSFTTSLSLHLPIILELGWLSWTSAPSDESKVPTSSITFAYPDPSPILRQDRITRIQARPSSSIWFLTTLKLCLRAADLRRMYLICVDPRVFWHGESKEKIWRSMSLEWGFWCLFGVLSTPSPILVSAGVAGIRYAYLVPVWMIMALVLIELAIPRIEAQEYVQGRTGWAKPVSLRMGRVGVLPEQCSERRHSLTNWFSMVDRM